MCDTEATANRADANVRSEAPIASAALSAHALARLMERQLGYPEGHIDPIAIRLFIRAYWSRVSKYAHTIHEEPT